MWETILINTEFADPIMKNINLKIKDHINDYLDVAKATGVPWELIVALHYRESNCSFKTCLHNGDPLPGPTVCVPKGRGPFKNWTDGAIDALNIEKLHPEKWTGVPDWLNAAEHFNGVGYRRKNIFSPYVWNGTQFYRKGKYVSDGFYNPWATDKQLGVAVILKKLLSTNA